MQQRTIEGYAHMHGWQVTQSFIEAGVSGSKPIADRPQGKALLNALKAGDIVITAKLDRMFRSARDALDVLAKLKAQGVSLHMIDLGGDVTGNGISKSVFTILSAVAEAERDRIATVKADQKARKRYLGGKVPFGFQLGDDGTLQPDQVQQAAIAAARQMRADGAKLHNIQLTLHERFGVRLSMGGLHGIVTD